MPKRPAGAYNIYNAEFVKKAREKDTNLKTADAFKQAGAHWATMDEKAKKPYNDAHDEEVKLYEKRITEREKKGYFLFDDGTKSTDPKNKDRVAKDKVAKEKKKINSDGESEEEDVMQPPRVKGAYAFFVQKFELPEGAQQKDRMKLAGEKWQTLDEKEKAVYNKMNE